MGDLSKVEFVTTHPVEVTTFNRTIQNFPAIIQLGLPNPCLFTEFEIKGHNGVTSNWKLELSHEKGDIYLQLCPVGPLLDSEGTNKFVFEATVKWNSVPPSYSHRVTCTPILKRIRWETFDRIKEFAGRDGKLEMQFKIFRVLGKPSSGPGEEEAAFSRKWMEQYRVELSNNLGSMLETGVNSDCVIQIQDSNGNLNTMKVHKAILGSRSPVFRKMLESPEQGTGSMMMTDLSSECAKILLKWMYTGQLDNGWEKVPEEMVNAAKKYELNLLLEYLDKNLHIACDLDNAIKLGKLAQLHGMTFASKKIAEFIEANKFFLVIWDQQF